MIGPKASIPDAILRAAIRERPYVVLSAASKASGSSTSAPRRPQLPYGTSAESPLMLAGANRPLAGIVKSFSDLVISESYGGQNMRYLTPRTAWSQLGANVGLHKY